MSRGEHVVGRVIAIVQQYPVRDASGNVAGVIDRGFEVAILMLQQVNGDQKPLSEQPRPNTIRQCGTPIQQEEQQDGPVSKNAFGNGLPVEAWPRLAPVVEVSRFVA